MATSHNTKMVRDTKKLSPDHILQTVTCPIEIQQFQTRRTPLYTGSRDDIISGTQIKANNS